MTKDIISDEQASREKAPSQDENSSSVRPRMSRRTKVHQEAPTRVKKSRPSSIRRKAYDPFHLDEECPGFLEEISLPPALRLNTLLVVVCCVVAMAVLNFVAIAVPDPYAEMFSIHETFLYTFQLPFAIFVGALLGSGFGLMTVLVYTGLALFYLPLFSGGGGWEYIFEPGFGYYWGMGIGAFMAGRLIQNVFHRSGPSGRSLLLLVYAFAAVALVHGVGALYLLGLTLTGYLSWPELNHWWLAYTGAPFVYDVIATMVMFCLVRVTRIGLWFALY
jgi:biotin transporter BioY